MHDLCTSGGRALSRRRLCAKAAGGLLLPAMLLAGRSAEAKTTKQTAQYQDQPKNGLRCTECRFYLGDGGCRVVEGEISPDGWCALFQQKKD